jgi:hypothetical protein
MVFVDGVRERVGFSVGAINIKSAAHHTSRVGASYRAHLTCLYISDRPFVVRQSLEDR